MMLQERLLIRTWSCTSPRGLTCLNRLGDLAARGTLIGPYLFCQDLGLSWKSTSSRAGCVYASHRGLDKHLSDRSLWADCHSVGRKPGKIRRSFAGRTLEQQPNDFVPFGFVLYRLGFVRRHRVSDDQEWASGGGKAAQAPAIWATHCGAEDRLTCSARRATDRPRSWIF